MLDKVTKMNTINNIMNSNNELGLSDFYNNRTFQDVDSLLSGKSVVLENSSSQENIKASTPDMWPYSLNEYLKFYAGRTVQIEYVLPNGRCCVKRGELKVSGTNFIGIQLCQSNDLFLLDLNTIKSISIFKYKGNEKKYN